MGFSALIVHFSEQQESPRISRICRFSQVKGIFVGSTYNLSFDEERGSLPPANSACGIF